MFSKQANLMGAVNINSVCMCWVKFLQNRGFLVYNLGMSPFRERGIDLKTGRPKRLEKIPDINNQKEGKCGVCDGKGEVYDFGQHAYCSCAKGKAMEEQMRTPEKGRNISRPEDPNIDDEGASQFSSKN